MYLPQPGPPHQTFFLALLWHHIPACLNRRLISGTTGPAGSSLDFGALCEHRGRFAGLVEDNIYASHPSLSLPLSLRVGLDSVCDLLLSLIRNTSTLRTTLQKSAKWPSDSSCTSVIWSRMSPKSATGRSIWHTSPRNKDPPCHTHRATSSTGDVARSGGECGRNPQESHRSSNWQHHGPACSHSWVRVFFLSEKRPTI